MKIGSTRGIKWPSYGHAQERGASSYAPAVPAGFVSASVARAFQALDVTVSVDPVRVNGENAGPGVSITGEQAPTAAKDWWPWILGAAALGALWWLVKDDVREEGANVQRPFAG